MQTDMLVRHARVPPNRRTQSPPLLSTCIPLSPVRPPSISPRACGRCTATAKCGPPAAPSSCEPLCRIRGFVCLLDCHRFPACACTHGCRPVGAATTAPACAATAATLRQPHEATTRRPPAAQHRRQQRRQQPGPLPAEQDHCFRAQGQQAPAGGSPWSAFVFGQQQQQQQHGQQRHAAVRGVRFPCPSAPVANGASPPPSNTPHFPAAAQVASTAGITKGMWVRVYALARSPASEEATAPPGTGAPPAANASTPLINSLPGEPGRTPLTPALLRQLAVGQVRMRCIRGVALHAWRWGMYASAPACMHGRYHS